MKIKNLLFVAFATVGSFTVSAQSNLLNAKTPEEIGKKTAAQLNSDNDKPLPYGYVHDRDVLMGKTIWEFIDIDERINFPMYYPIDTAFVGKERRSLFDVLVKNIKNGKIQEVYNDDYFNSKKTLKDMESSFTFIDTTDAGKDEINNFYDDYKSGAKVLHPQYINKTDLTAQKEREAEENFTNELLGKVCDNANVEIPAVMIDAEVDRMYKEFEGRMQQSGFTAKQFLDATHQTEEAIRAQMSPEAAARVKTQLVLEAIVKAESIEASDEDVEKEFTTMSEMYNMEVEKIKSLISPESIKADLANQKALDFIKTSVK